MNRFLLLISLSFCIVKSFSQKTITVKDKYTKQLIYTFKKGERLSRGESRINIKADGAGYEFTLQDSVNRCFLYKDGKNLGEYAGHYFSDAEAFVKVAMKGDEKQYIVQLKSGEKFGPYKVAYPITDREGKNVTGIRYNENDKKFFRSLIKGTNYGPYQDIGEIRHTKEQLIFSFKRDDKWYVVYNDKKFGPYDKLNVTNLFYLSENEMFYFHCGTLNSSGALEWRTIADGKEIPFVFSACPSSSTFYKNGNYRMKVKLKEEGEEKFYLIINGKKYPNDTGGNEYVSNELGEVISYDFDKSKLKNGIVTVRDNGTVVGRYCVNEIWGATNKSPYFPLLLMDTVGTTKNVYIYGNKKTIYVGKQNEIKGNVSLNGNDYYYIRNKDSVLIKNGVETQHTGVVSVSFHHSPSMIIYKKEGKFDVFYKDGKVLNREELIKLKYYPDRYNLKDNPYSFVVEDSKTYVLAKGSTQKTGPVNRESQFQFSKGNKHMAECNNRTMQVFIDNKLFSPGFCLAYNSTTNTFHWFSQEENKLYLHSYQND